MPLNTLTPSTQLWVVATPLGNVEDLSPRARHILEHVDVVLAEDTRRAGLLFQRCGLVAKRFLSVHEHNEEERCQGLIQLLSQGSSAALISDAGTPLMADPGFRLVRACRKAGIGVSMVPGPCAPIAALMVAGIAPQPFTFLGFLPRDVAGKEALLAPYALLPTTLVFFERKDRLHATLQCAYTLLGPRDVVIARELTKTHEEILTGRLEQSDAFPRDIKGEITVIVGPPEKQERSSEAAVMQRMQEELRKGGKPREVARRVQSTVMGWTAKEIYLLLSHKEDHEG